MKFMVQGPVVGSCEHGSEPSGSIKGREFLDWLSDCWHLMEDWLYGVDYNFSQRKFKNMFTRILYSELKVREKNGTHLTHKTADSVRVARGCI
jgi:hypothetical protein